MYYFNCDYNEGAAPQVIERLTHTNLEQTPGYGEDCYCRAAADLIRELCDAPEAAVHFLVGGTQTNATVITAALRPHQGVVAADTGHIHVHETGAVEFCGHKVIALPQRDGKITAAQAERCCLDHINDASFEHMSQPKMVYISQSTELGTIYAKAELEALYAVCRKYGLYLFVDGARLGYALTASDSDLTLRDMARLCDVFFIGGTKQGALFGEAVVILNDELKRDFRYIIKQQGAMLAKGRLLGLQFLALLENDLYMELARHANALADRIRRTLSELGVPMLVESRTNQIFPILPDAALKALESSYAFSYQQRMDETHSAVRICTSWATPPDAAERLCEDLAAAIGEVRS